MPMQHLLVRLPEELVRGLKRTVPARGRSALVQQLLEQALPSDADDGDQLYRLALVVERDEKLAAEMADWDATAGDGVACDASGTGS